MDIQKQIAEIKSMIGPSSQAVDDLLEMATEKAGKPIDVFSVSLIGGAVNAAFVRALSEKGQGDVKDIADKCLKLSAELIEKQKSNPCP